VEGRPWQADETGRDERRAARPERVHRGSARAPPARSVSSPQPEGRPRPVGRAALADTMVPQAVVPLRTPIDAEAGRGVSAGVRPGRRPPQALDARAGALTRQPVHDGRDGALRGGFDTLAPEGVVPCRPPRVAAPRGRRLLQQGRRAGVSAQGPWAETTRGVPPGAVVSPLRAHVSWHDVVVRWGEAWRTRIAPGDVVGVRVADDRGLGFAPRAEAARVVAA
jgi:RNA-directed DNA polymerase